MVKYWFFFLFSLSLSLFHHNSSFITIQGKRQYLIFFPSSGTFLRNEEETLKLQHWQMQRARRLNKIYSRGTHPRRGPTDLICPISVILSRSFLAYNRNCKSNTTLWIVERLPRQKSIQKSRPQWGRKGARERMKRWNDEVHGGWKDRREKRMKIHSTCVLQSQLVCSFNSTYPQNFTTPFVASSLALSTEPSFFNYHSKVRPTRISRMYKRVNKGIPGVKQSASRFMLGIYVTNFRGAHFLPL